MAQITRVESHKRVYKRLRAYTWLYSIFVSAVLLALLFTVVLRGIKIEGDGMNPAVSSGDVVLFCSLSKHISSPARGGIIAYNSASGYVEIGRVIALPHESVTIRGGSVYINGILLAEDYVSGAAADMETVTLDAGEFFILPDSRENLSLTPENAQTLVVPFESILGSALLRVAPYSRICLFG